MTETDMDALPSWSVDGFVFEATKFSDRTVPEQVERVDLEVTTDEIGLVLKGELLRVCLSLLFTQRAKPSASQRLATITTQLLRCGHRWTQTQGADECRARFCCIKM